MSKKSRKLSLSTATLLLQSRNKPFLYSELIAMATIINDYLKYGLNDVVVSAVMQDKKANAKSNKPERIAESTEKNKKLY